MSRMIRIRNIPDYVHRKLKIRAAKEGLTLSELLGREVRKLVEQPTLDELRDYFLLRPRRKLRMPPAVIIRQHRDGDGCRHFRDRPICRVRNIPFSREIRAGDEVPRTATDRLTESSGRRRSAFPNGS